MLSKALESLLAFLATREMIAGHTDHCASQAPHNISNNFTPWSIFPRRMVAVCMIWFTSQDTDKLFELSLPSCCIADGGCLHELKCQDSDDQLHELKPRDSDDRFHELESQDLTIDFRLAVTSCCKRDVTFPRY